ncbi:MAG: hypothetical protein ACE5EO_11365 [Candidatus Krumholzibacteriia bacterium]
MKPVHSTRPAGRRRFARLVALALAAGATLFVTASAGARSDPDAERIVKSMIRAHGGMGPWRSAPTVSFHDAFQPAGAPAPLVSEVTVEQGPRRAYIDYPEMGMNLCWDGEKAWSVGWKLPYAPRFMALLNYYFVNLPWLTQDPGVLLGEVSSATLWDDPTSYITVRMTFEAGVGDTPDDYYVLYIDPKTHMLKGCRYVVTYESLLPEGMTQTPEHILVFDSFETVGGLAVPTHYTIYETDKKLYAECGFSKWSFTKPFDTARMTMAEGAVLDESKP